MLPPVPFGPVDALLARITVEHARRHRKRGSDPQGDLFDELMPRHVRGCCDVSSVGKFGGGASGGGVGKAEGERLSRMSWPGETSKTTCSSPVVREAMWQIASSRHAAADSAVALMPVMAIFDDFIQP